MSIEVIMRDGHRFMPQLLVDFSALQSNFFGLFVPALRSFTASIDCFVFPQFSIFMLQILLDFSALQSIF